jgi:hypothetical protein
VRDKLHELKRLADEIAHAVEWKEPWQRRAWDDGIEAALKAAHVSLNGPAQARTRVRNGDVSIDRDVEIVPYPNWRSDDGGDS